MIDAYLKFMVCILITFMVVFLCGIFTVLIRQLILHGWDLFK